MPVWSNFRLIGQRSEAFSLGNVFVRRGRAPVGQEANQRTKFAQT